MARPADPEATEVTGDLGDVAPDEAAEVSDGAEVTAAESSPGAGALSAVRGRSRRTWLAASYVLLAVVVIGALFAGTRDNGAPRTPDERATALALTLKCPTCRSQSVQNSDAPASKAIKAEIVREIGEGRTDAEIRGFLVQSYGQDILLTPSSKGFTGLVWIVPVMAFIAAVGGIVLVFRRWRRWA